MYVQTFLLAFLAVLVAGCTSEVFPREPCPAEFAQQGCTSRVTEAAARSIAADAGLGAGIFDWKVVFFQNADGWFGWEISNTTYSGRPVGAYLAYGHVVSVRADSGAVVSVGPWSAQE